MIYVSERLLTAIIGKFEDQRRCGGGGRHNSGEGNKSELHDGDSRVKQNTGNITQDMSSLNTNGSTDLQTSLSTSPPDLAHRHNYRRITRLPW